jgi:hypothetical protein
VNVSQLKTWAHSPTFAQLSAAVLVAKAAAEVTREKVDAYIRPVFDRYGFKDEDGRPIESPRQLYLCKDDAACDRFFAECTATHRANGYTLPDGYCPALVAETKLIEAENALINEWARVFGVTDGQRAHVTLDTRDKLLNLLLGLAVMAGKDGGR